MILNAYLDNVYLTIKFIGNPEKSIFLFVGRNQSSQELLSLYQGNEFIKNTYRLYVLSPEKEWYPKPHGITNQKSALKGLERTSLQMQSLIRELVTTDNLNTNQIILSGFSAGAVVAFDLFLNGKYKSMISHNGTILDVQSIKPSKSLSPILMIHNRDDEIFTWEERYLPAKNTLLKQEYNLSAIEKFNGGHSVSKEDIDYVSVFLNQI